MAYGEGKFSVDIDLLNENGRERERARAAGVDLGVSLNHPVYHFTLCIPY